MWAQGLVQCGISLQGSVRATLGSMNPNPPTLLARRAHHVSPLWHLPPPSSGFHTAGYIGGRMVKWLEEIEVASEESDNYYHRKVRVCRKGGVCRFVPRLAKCTLGVGPRGSN